MKFVKYLFAVTFLVLGLAGCKYGFIWPEDIPDTDTIEVSFAADIQPIFTDRCIICHNGTRNPNLTSGNSYTSLSSGYINTNNPEESLIYKQPIPNGGGSHLKYTQAEAALVLGWIKQGAKNN